MLRPTTPPPILFDQSLNFQFILLSVTALLQFLLIGAQCLTRRLIHLVLVCHCPSSICRLKLQGFIVRALFTSIMLILFFLSERLGAHKRTDTVGTEQDFRVTKVIMHPFYYKPVGMSHDISCPSQTVPTGSAEQVSSVGT